MVAGQGQTDYTPITHRWEAQTSDAVAPRVWSLGGSMDAPNVETVRRTEAEHIARLLKGVVSGEWQILDAQASDSAGSEQYRPSRLSDICILMPTRAGLSIIEQALEDADIPFRLEGASLVFTTQEVRDLLKLSESN